MRYAHIYRTLCLPEIARTTQIQYRCGGSLVCLKAHIRVLGKTALQKLWLVHSLIALLVCFIRMSQPTEDDCAVKTWLPIAAQIRRIFLSTQLLLS